MNDIVASANTYMIPIYKKRDIALVRGEGVYVFDENDKKYLDFCSQFGVAGLGHSHPDLQVAVNSQLNNIISVHNSFYCAPRAELARKMSTMLPNPLNKVTFLSTGTECVEISLKIARVTTGRDKIIATKGSYHGRTLGALSVTGQAKYQKGFAPLLPHVQHVPFDDLDAMAEVMSDEVAAVIVEPIQAESGVRMPSENYLKGLRDLCDKHGALLICDEVQVGTYRTGTITASEQYGIVPDIICLSKAIGGGVPLGVVGITDEVNEKVPSGAHGTTFGGNAISTAAGIAVLDAFEKHKIADNIKEVGEYLLEQLQKLAGSNSRIRDVRGKGLILAVEFKEKVSPILKAMQERGVIAISSGSTIIRLLPPYIITKEHCDEFVAVLTEVIS